MWSISHLADLPQKRRPLPGDHVLEPCPPAFDVWCITLDLVKGMPGLPGWMHKWIQKASDMFIEWLWQKDSSWFMHCTLWDVWCEVIWNQMNNSACRSIVSSHLPCYCYFYIIAKWKIKWCHKQLSFDRIRPYHLRGVLHILGYHFEAFDAIKNVHLLKYGAKYLHMISVSVKKEK